MTKDEALKLALEALEDIFGKNKVDVTVINVIKEALAQPEQEPVAIGDIRALKHRIHELEGEVIGYKRILDAQPAQEPDAQITVEHYSSDFENITVDFCNLEKGVHLLYTTPPQRKPLTDEEKRKTNDKR